MGGASEVEDVEAPEVEDAMHGDALANAPDSTDPAEPEDLEEAIFRRLLRQAYAELEGDPRAQTTAEGEVARLTVVARRRRAATRLQGMLARPRDREHSPDAWLRRHVVPVRLRGDERPAPDPPRPGRRPAESGDGADVLARALDAVRLAAPVHHRGLTAVPLLARAAVRRPGYRLLDEAARAGGLEISERSGAFPAVGRLRARNRGRRPVLLLDGEEVEGGWQDRACARTVLVPAGATVDLPVHCVEPDRWSAAGPLAPAPGRMLHATARALVARLTTEALRGQGGGDAQAAVWAALGERSLDLGPPRESVSLARLHEACAPDLAGYEAVLSPRPGQVGAVFCVAGTVRGVEIFDSPRTYAGLRAKLVASYAVEARAARVRGPRTGDASAALAAARELLAKVRRTAATVHQPPGLGTELRLGDDGIAGGALVAAGRVVHLAAFDAAGT